MRRLPIVFLLLAVSLRAEDKPREIFPSDYTPSACAPAVSCISYSDAEMQSAASRFLGLNLDPIWDAKHGAEIKAAVAPFCVKHATCMTMPSNTYMVCDDILAAEVRPAVCPKLFPKETSAKDFEQCSMFLETYLLGIDNKAINVWKQAQACAKKQPPVTHAKPLDVWMVPAEVPYDFKGYVTFYGIDPETRVPLLADIKFQDQILYDEANPAGRAATFYPMKLPFRYLRVPNKEGHADAVTPMVTITAEGYPPATFRLNAPVPKAIAEMKPAQIHPGKNEIIVTAKDSLNGKPIDGRVMLGKDEIGFTNQPIAFEWKAGTKRPEIWLKPYLPRYSDVVLVPAAK